MQEKLIIYLQASVSERPSWAIIDVEGHVRECAWQDEPTGLAQIADGKEVIVLLSSHEVSLFSVVLPKMNRSRLMQALSFALEEQLIADLESLHFVPGPYQDNGELAVCVISHEKMQTYLQQLNTWQIKPHVFMPDIFALPYVNGEWQAVLGDMLIVRTGLFQGFACDKINADKMLELAKRDAKEAPSEIKLKQYQHETDFIKNLAKIAALQEGINLLSGPYAVKKSRLPQTEKLWRLSIYLASASIFLWLIYPLVSYFILSSQLHHFDKQIAEIYRRQFPQASSIVAPKMRMEEKLRKLKEQNGDHQLFSLIAYLGQGMRAAKNIKLKRMDFQHGQLVVELTAASSEDFSQLTDTLTQLGLMVKQQNANLNGDRLNATITLEM